MAETPDLVLIVTGDGEDIADALVQLVLSWGACG